jgi:type IV pilus assembly protein PilN
MIRINLAGPSSQASFATPSTGFGGGDIILTDSATRMEGLKRLLVIFILPLGMIIYEQQNLPTKEAVLGTKAKALAEVQAFNSKYTASVAEIKKFKEDQEKIQARISALEKISKDRLREIRVLDLFQQAIPEKVWFTRVEAQGTKILISGNAMSDYEISNFMEAIAKSAFLTDVNLLSSSEVVIDGVSVKKFEISCLTERAAAP